MREYLGDGLYFGIIGFLRWWFMFILVMGSCLLGFASFISILFVGLQWFTFFVELGVVDNVSWQFLLGVFVLACYGTYLLFKFQKLMNWTDKKQEEWKWDKPHLEYFLYPDDRHLELEWVDGVFRSEVMLTTKENYMENTEGIRDELKSDVTAKKLSAISLHLGSI